MAFDTLQVEAVEGLLSFTNNEIGQVSVIRCSWFGNITINEFKQSEKFSTKQGFMMFTYEI